ncbi:MAG TPA: NAD-dependent epimerase/dehydratase family protein [Vicinamibacterales bacterium]|nr:NAD-dependent epimerase/dehydratase family protein [Vicinamibacterales bacterium]
MTGVENRGGRTMLVTGAAGFIGSPLCARLRSHGCRVIGYDDLSRGRRERLAQDVQLIEGDVRDAARVKHTISAFGPDCVIHLAAMHFIPDCIDRPEETMDVNVEGTRHVLEGCRGSSVRSVVFASSAAVYAPTDRPCIEDATPLRPLEVYGESKLAAEQLVRAFHEETGIPMDILRLFNAIGRNETNAHVVPHILESLQRSDVVRLGNITPRRDYIDTRDVAEAILAVADSCDGLRVFNVGTGVAHSVKEVVEVLGRILGRTITVVEEPARVRATERMLLVADISKIQQVTQWTPRIPLEDALADLAAAYRVRSRLQVDDR